MFRVHAVQAFFGDCLILEYGSAAAPKYVLIDGGPPDAFEKHLKPAFAGINGGIRKLELVMLSHVDNDHVVGLLDFFAEKPINPVLPEVAEIWHNSFTASIDPTNVIAPRVAALLATANAAAMTTAVEEVLGISEGARLGGFAATLNIPMNDIMNGKPITVDAAPDPVEDFGDLTLRVVGPTKRNLAELKKKWDAWKNKVEQGVMTNDVEVMANADKSVPNLSSIMVLAEANGRTALLTGDGRSDHLIEGLDQRGLLDEAGMLHVDLLKVAHHGSSRNHTKAFFSRITADKYVISADGTYDNPDYETLVWIVEAADEDGRQIEICVTNDTPSTIKLKSTHKTTKYKYKLTVMPQASHWMTTVV